MKFLIEDIEAVMKYYPEIPEDTFRKLISLDPTYKANSNNLGKYGKWILNLYKKDKLDNEGHITDLIKRFNDNKNQLKDKDIGKFKSMQELEDYLNDESNYNQLSNRQELRQVQNKVHRTNIQKDAILVYEDSDWEVWIPKTYEASCKLGANSNWCTASTSSDYYYRYYTNQGKLYINIYKHNPKIKYQFHFETNSFMDKDDHRVSLSEVVKGNQNLALFYKKEINKKREVEPIRKLLWYDDLGIKVSNEEIIEVLNKDTDFRLNKDGSYSFTWPFEYLDEELKGREFADGFLNGCMTGDLFDYWDMGEVYLDNHLEEIIGVDYINQESWNILNKFDITKDNIFEKLRADKTLSDEYEDIISAIYSAVRDATIMGGINEAINDFNDSFDKAIPDYVIYKRAENEEEAYTFTVTNILEFIKANKDLFMDKVEDYGADIAIEETLIQYMKDEFNFYEPQYGWYGFDEEYFSARLEDELTDIENKYLKTESLVIKEAFKKLRRLR